MPEWINPSNMNPVIVAAVVDDDYTKGRSDYSVTQLIDTPYRVKMMNSPEMKNVVVDVQDMIYALFGKLIHSLLETGYVKTTGEKAAIVNELCPGYSHITPEERLYANDLGVTWSGQYDLYYQRYGKWILEDHKVVGITEFKMNRMESKWEQQLNLLALLLRRNGKVVDEVAINAYYRDWSKAKAMYDKSGEYPPTHHQRIVVNLWDEKRQQNFLEHRLDMHLNHADEPCSLKDRWGTGERWRVVVPGAVRSSRFYSEGEALDYIARRKGDPKLRAKYSKAVVEHIEGASLRCMLYCQASQICPHWKQLNTGKYGGSIDHMDSSTGETQ